MIAPLSADAALGVLASGSRAYRSELGGTPLAWQEPVQLENSSFTHGVGVAVDAGGEGVAAWGNLSGSCYRVAAAERNAGGVSAPTALSAPCVWSRYPTVGLADDGTAHVAWYDQQTAPYTAKVRSRVNGTWEPTVVLNDATTELVTDGVDLATAPGGRTVALWVEQSSSHSPRLVARVREPGADAEWGARQVLSAAGRLYVTEAELRTDAAGRFTVGWVDDGGLQVRELDAGGTWGAARTLCACQPGRAHLGVAPDGTAAVVYRRSDVVSAHLRRGGEWGARLTLTERGDYREGLIALTGAIEILGGLGLMGPRRYQAHVALALAAYLVAVFPANVHVAIAGVDVDGQPGGIYPWLRLAFQPLFIWWALSSVPAASQLLRRIEAVPRVAR